MASFLGEIKRRKVFQVAAVYLVVAWLLVQIVATVEAPLNLPDWVDTLVIVLLAVGFPIAIILSWAFDLTANGVERAGSVPSGDSEPAETMAATTGLAVNLTVIGALAALLALVGLYVFWSGQRSTAADGSETRSQQAELTAVEREVLPNSVAVLPFENMSADPEDAYFAAGLHDEILNQLAKLESLNVIARTSVMQYAGAARPITEIARELNVGTIMEGSVSYAAGRVAIRAQLIDAGTGFHLWSDSYNREFSDVFAIQADIAMNVANALQAEFSLAEQERIQAAPTDVPEAYALFLRASAESASAAGTAIRYLDQAIELDSQFALAYAARAYWYAEVLEGAFVDPAEAAALMPIVRENAERALALDPTIGMAHSALANLYNVAGDLDEAQSRYERALEVSPNDTNAMALFSRFKRYTGDYDEAIRLGERSVVLGPNDPFANLQQAFNYWYAQNYAAAAAAFRRCIELDAAFEAAHAGLGFTEVSRGNDDEALSELRIAEQLRETSGLVSSLRLAQHAFAHGQMGRADDARRYFETLAEVSTGGAVAEAVWAMAYFAIADYDEAYRRLENAVNNPQAGEQIALSELKANAYGDPLLDEPHWRDLRNRIGVF
jgi:TolB-like protein/Tfp pilus assembly protein PilF